LPEISTDNKGIYPDVEISASEKDWIRVILDLNK
jgi:hypothetical protein